jgi:hypothetical protein
VCARFFEGAEERGVAVKRQEDSEGSEVGYAVSFCVTCVLCNRLHQPERVLDFNPVCPGCIRLARHEAGHAVAAALLYRRGSVATARMGRDERAGPTGCLLPLAALGVCVADPPKRMERASPWKRRVLEAFGTQCYAGIATERGDVEFEDFESRPIDSHQPIHGPVEDEALRLLWDHSEQDRENLASFAQGLGLSRPANCWHGPSWRRARWLVSSHWAAVDVIAAELISRRSMAGRRIEALIGNRRTRRRLPETAPQVA